LQYISLTVPLFNSATFMRTLSVKHMCHVWNISGVLFEKVRCRELECVALDNNKYHLVA
jgi:hypothetical protein